MRTTTPQSRSFWSLFAESAKQPRNWTSFIAKTSSGLPDASELVRTILDDERHLPAILITLCAKLRAFEMATDLHGATCMSLWLLTGVLNQGRLN